MLKWAFRPELEVHTDAKTLSFKHFNAQREGRGFSRSLRLSIPTRDESALQRIPFFLPRQFSNLRDQSNPQIQIETLIPPTMSSQPLYPQIHQSNPNPNPHAKNNPQSSSKRESLYPSIDTDDPVQNLFPVDVVYINDNSHSSSSAPPQPLEQSIIKLPGAILHLIDKHYSVQLASGDFTVISLTQGGNILAVLARVGDEIQWPLTKDQAAVKLDDSHYFFSFCAPGEEEDTCRAEDVMSYGLTFACKGQEFLLMELDRVLEHYSNFSVQKVVEKGERSGVLDVTMAKEMRPNELSSDKEKRELMEKKCAAYWTTLAPNVEDYSGSAAKMIAAGSGQLIKGILWCGDVTIDRLKWGNEVMMKRMSSKSKSEVSPETLKRIKR